ncbi:hypothetical protein HK098_002275 [Nowakowskiella sp. JEL0407]|nr:hypothetical protein HK098_002275 [Nowakowskiella sp. JEL0407]
MVKEIRLKVTDTKPSPTKYDPIVLVDSPEQTEMPKGHSKVKIAAAALNHRDVFIRQGLYPGIKDNSILGGDGSGWIVESDSPELKKGMEILMNPMFGFESGRAPKDPSKVAGLGLLPLPGTLAETIVVPNEMIHPKPRHLSFAEGAALPLAGLTAWRATFTKGEVTKDSVVLIPGIGGGVALFCLQLCVAVGATAYVTSSEETKIKRAVELGAKGGVNYKNENWVKELKELAGTPFDVILDGAGGADSMKNYTSLLRAGGIISSFGATAGANVTVNLAFIFLKNIELRGVFLGSDEELKELLKFISEHKIKPVVSQVYEGLEQSEDAFQLMKDGKQFGKIVVEVNKGL